MATTPSLASAQERFLAHHEALNHSHKQLAHFRTTFRDFERFLGATRRKKALDGLRTETFEAFIV